ncbi:MAG: hypothetical protein GY855_12780 [candidate division Zixibacteria bacterium]|nr:hypothetical protein [candidate division Zixibacteria bacterium]
MKYRKYNPKKDKKAVHRIWKEVGWIEGDDYKPMDIFIESANTIVADIEGEPECLALSSPGNIDYMGKKLVFYGITGVTTSLIARRQKLAAKLTATRIALDAEEGASVSGLGIFEQGYYDKLGYGTGGYEHICYFSPANMKVNSKFRVPKRLDKSDWEKIHNSRLNRIRGHGSISFDQPQMTQAETLWAKTGFGYGYYNAKGDLTHHLWMDGIGKEQGPFNIYWMNYRNYNQFLELMALIQSFGEQINLVRVLEPPNIQMQDFLIKPFHYRQITDNAKYQNITKATAYWQMRILNLKKCLVKTHLDCRTFKFNLELTDPIEDFLGDDVKWRGLTGNYIITIGKNSKAELGNNSRLPTMKTPIGAFTRMWLGVLPATGLSVTDKLSAPDVLLKKLDKAFRLPTPKIDWDF